MGENMDMIYREISSNLRGLRAQKGYSQAYVASRLGISQNAYSKIERGATRIDVEHIYKLATVLEVPVTGLLPASAASAGINTTGLPEFLRKVRDIFARALAK